MCLECINNLELSVNGECVWNECDSYITNVMPTVPSDIGEPFAELLHTAYCLDCAPGFSLFNTICLPCSDNTSGWNNCESCSFNTDGTLKDCVQCFDPMIIYTANSGSTPAHQCMFPIIPDCQIYSSDGLSCQKCIDTKGWNGTSCEPCLIEMCNNCEFGGFESGF